jgi:hypothetical protein
MKIYCTPCCKEKRDTKELLDAIERYQSDRIRAVFEQSKSDKVELRILSGKFGLLKPQDKIPFYDHPLTAKEIPSLKERVKQQLREQGIDAVVFFSKTQETPEWKPYVDVMTQACAELGIVLERRVSS